MEMEEIKNSNIMDDIRGMKHKEEQLLKWMCEIKSKLTLAQRVIFNGFWVKAGYDPFFIIDTSGLPRSHVDLESVIWWNQRILSESFADWLYGDPFKYVWVYYEKHLIPSYPPVNLNYRYLKGIKIDDVNRRSADIDEFLSGDGDHIFQMLVSLPLIDIYKDKHNVLLHPNDNDINTDWLKRKTK